MNIIELIHHYAVFMPTQAAIVSDEGTLTYRELELYSDSLSHEIATHYGTDSTPIVVYGHKHPFMFVCFLACVKAGRAYCPIDITVPSARVKAIIDMVNPPVILAVSPLLNATAIPVWDLVCLTQTATALHAPCSPRLQVSGSDAFYIIFTSGSTGNPKGVTITCDCLNHFLDWAVDLGIPRSEKISAHVMNQAPFSFDLSVMDLYTSLACGGTLFTLSKETQSDYRRTFSVMERSHAKIWVSTPSFADICLADKCFDSLLLPELSLFLFCGETLTNRTALALLDRFPKAVILNTYGPTESTVAMTQVTITKELAQNCSPLPVGSVKPGSYVLIQDESGHTLSDGEIGEIIILGDTVSTGYFHQEELTKQAFFTCVHESHSLRGYRTGDAGYLKNGLLYYCGRIDLQVKLHGYRIEIEDIEQNLLKVPGIKNAVVTPTIQEHKVKSLTAHIVYEEPVLDRFQITHFLKEQLRCYLPDYMIPKKFQFWDHLPLTANGKADRKKLGANLS